jgi:hypothetical protein
MFPATPTNEFMIVVLLNVNGNHLLQGKQFNFQPLQVTVTTVIYHPNISIIFLRLVAKRRTRVFINAWFAACRASEFQLPCSRRQFQHQEIF